MKNSFLMSLYEVTWLRIQRLTFKLNCLRLSINFSMKTFSLFVMLYNLFRYYHLVIDVEPYYGLSPGWLRLIHDSFSEAARKRVLNETVVYEMYKKYFGRKKATHYKVNAWNEKEIFYFSICKKNNHQNPEYGLRICAQRGLACIFQALARKFPASALGKPNIRDGLTLMHYAVRSSFFSWWNIAMLFVNFSPFIIVQL